MFSCAALLVLFCLALEMGGGALDDQVRTWVAKASVTGTKDELLSNKELRKHFQVFLSGQGVEEKQNALAFRLVQAAATKVCGKKGQRLQDAFKSAKLPLKVSSQTMCIPL